MRMNQWRIGTRLAFAFGSMGALLLGVAAVGWLALQSVHRDLEHIEHAAEKSRLNQSMSEQVHIVNRVMRTLILLDDPEQKSAEAAKIETARRHYDKASAALNATPAGEKGIAIRRAIDTARDRARAVNNQILTLARENHDEDARRMLMEQGLVANQAWQDAIDKNLEFLDAAAAKEHDDAAASYLHALTWMAVVVGLSLALAALAGWLITVSITRPINYVRDCALRMAAGDLTVRVERRSGQAGRDEPSQLVEAMQNMHDSLCNMVSSVHANAASVATASQQIAGGNIDLSRRTEQQAAHLQQTAATMEQLATTVKGNTDATVQAAELAGDAGAVAARGGDVMQQVVSTMQGIDNSSKRIADIIGVIDGIAFQTNILALNAAVEAARAGEAGRGFAVVASEVRTLAQRSAAAAREIKSLIQASVEQVDAGTGLVQQAGATMGDIQRAIERVNTLMGEVRSATREQSAGITQVSGSVAQMDQATQQNAALVEESAAAAQSLSQQAQTLMGQVSKFRIADAPDPA
jgi:methyl-accepting chemotaxis protein